MAYTEVMTKVCSHCKTEQPLENFYRNNRNVDGRTNACKACKKIWAARTRENDILRYREWYQNNKDQARENTQRWRDEHREQHRESSRIAQRRRYAENPEKHRTASRNYNRANPDIVWQRHMRRIAERWGCEEITATYPEWLAILEQYGHKCYYCQRAGKMHTEHRTPLARGGAHAKDNLVPACNSCNVRKGQLTEEEFKAVLMRGSVGYGERVTRIMTKLGLPTPLEVGFQPRATTV